VADLPICGLSTGLPRHRLGGGNIFPVVMAVSTMIILVSTVVIAYIVKKGYVDIL